MSKGDPNNSNSYHNQGQEDAAEKSYDPPNSSILHWVHTHDYEQEQRDAYNAGYDHGKSQRDK